MRASLLDKGLKVNAGMSKVVVGRSGGEDECKLWKVVPVVSVGKECRANAVQCTVCTQWIHKRCSGVRGDLSAGS